jgi:hypothetical protein
MRRRIASALTPQALTRREAIQAGAIGLLGLSMAEVSAMRELAGAEPRASATSVIFIFLTGGLSQQDSFDPKPDAPDSVRGEFRPIDTKTPGIRICEHLPMLAARSDRYALVRSVETRSDDHAAACHMLLTGRLDLPTGFDLNGPTPNDWPSIPALATYATQGRNNMPPSIVLPEPSINEAGAVRPGQYAGRLGPRWDAWHLNVAAKCPLGNGACPDCFRFDGSPFRHAASSIIDPPRLSLPEGHLDRLRSRLGLLQGTEGHRCAPGGKSGGEDLDRHRRRAIALITDPRTRSAFDVERADPRTLERFGENKFGLSLLMAMRLIEAGVNLVQVNLGKNSSWDTHVGNFRNLKEHLLPPADRAVSALLDDLAENGRLGSTLVVMTGEFGRTPKVNKDAGRDHWGPVMTVLLAGGGIRGGTVIGASDRMGAYPIEDRQTPENLAATMYHALGIPRRAIWREVDGRPHEIYRAEPITGLM